jgi:hypothetical protein
MLTRNASVLFPVVTPVKEWYTVVQERLFIYSHHPHFLEDIFETSLV